MPASLFSSDRIPAIFCDEMILQRDAPIRVWGQSAPETAVTVQLGDDHEETVADADGNWSVSLPPQKANEEPQTLSIKATETHSFEGVLIGDVFLASGQSNMDWTAEECSNVDALMAMAAVDELRLFRIPRSLAEKPEFVGEGSWESASSESIADFSAIGFLVGKAVRESEGVPVGVIHSAWGGTRISAWTPHEAMMGHPVLQTVLDRWASELEAFPATKKAFEDDLPQLMAEWKLRRAAAVATGEAPPAEPRLRTGPNTHYVPSTLYDAMIAPLAPFSIKAVLWYQGESDVSRSEEYAVHLPAMMNAWRTQFDNSDLPWVVVQLPNISRGEEPTTSGWPEMREAQVKGVQAATPAAFTTNIDIGDPADIHPADKTVFAERIWRALEALVYNGDPAELLSPWSVEWAFGDGEAVIEFEPKGASINAKDKRVGLLIAGEDLIFHPADFKIQGSRLIVFSPSVPHPVAIRYAWASHPIAGLYSSTGLPVSPFRTDQWTCETVSYSEDALALLSR